MRGLPEGLTEDDRGVSTIIGFVLLFGILVVTLTLYQAHVVPQQNSEVELEHYQTIQEDMNELRTAHVNTVESGQQRAASLTVGTLYPSRTIAVNPSPIEGTLRSESLGEIELTVDGNPFNLTSVCGAPPKTSAIRYETDYTELSDREAYPVVYENSVIYRPTPGDAGPIVDTDQLLLGEGTIDLLPLQANVSDTGLTTSVELASDSYGPERSLDDEGTVTLTLPTLEPEIWRDRVLDGIDGVKQVTAGDGEVNITLEDPPEDGEKWSVRCAVATNSDEVPEAPETEDGQGGGGGGGGGQGEAGVGTGESSEYSSDNSTDTFTSANGKWLGIDNIAGIELFNGEPARLTGSQVSGQQGDVIELTFELRDGGSDDRITADVRLQRDPDSGQFNTQNVEFNDNSGNNQNLDLTTEAAEAIYGDGTVDILDEDNYQSTFDYDEGNFGWFVERIRQMENATWQTAEVIGRTDVRIVRGELLLTLDEESRNQGIREGGTANFTATVENLGATERTGNVDLVIRKDGNIIQSAYPYADRKTVTLASGATQRVNLTWDLDDDVSEDDYDAIIRTSDDKVGTKTYVTDDAVLEVSIDNVTSPIERGESFRLHATITNNGPDRNDPREVKLDLDDAGNDIASDSVSNIQVDAGETTSVTFDGIDTLSDIGTDGTGELVATVGNDNDRTITDRTTAVIRNADVVTNASVSDIAAGGSRQSQTFAFTLGVDLQGGDQIAVDLTDIGPELTYSDDKKDWTTANGSGKVNSVNSNNGQVQQVIYQVTGNQDAGDRVAIQTDANASSAESGTRYDVSIFVSSANSFAGGQQNGDREAAGFEAT